MIRMQCLDRVRSTTRMVDRPTFQGGVTDLIGTTLETSDEAQAFLIEQAPNSILPVHFHFQQQFQLFVGGSGTIGKTPIAPLTLHYATPHSGYGPLTAKEDGIAYLTVRPLSDTGAWFLPDSRSELRTDLNKFQRHTAPQSLVTDAQLKQLTELTLETLLAPEDNGLAAWLMRLPPGASAQAPAATARHEGRFYVVTKGALRQNGDTLPALGTIHVPSGETIELTADADGAEVVVLQFPYNAQFVAQT